MRKFFPAIIAILLGLSVPNSSIPAERQIAASKSACGTRGLLGSCPPTFDFSLTNGGPMTLGPSTTGVTMITAAYKAGGAQEIVISSSELPSGVNASFSKTSCLPTCYSNLTITTAPSVPAGNYPITVSAGVGSLSRSTIFMLTITAPVSTSPGPTTAALSVNVPQTQPQAPIPPSQSPVTPPPTTSSTAASQPQVPISTSQAPPPQITPQPAGSGPVITLSMSPPSVVDPNPAPATPLTLASTSLTAESGVPFAAETSKSSGGMWADAKARWESQMLTYGKMHCTTITTGKDQYGNVQNLAMLLGAVYYDAIQVYLQIYKYTNDPSWNACAKAAVGIYRDNYVFPNNGNVPGYWNFTTGLLMDYQINGDVISKDAEILLSRQAAFAVETTPLEWTASPLTSREVAYTIRSYLNAEKLGEPRRPRLADLVNQSLGMIDQWFVSKTYRAPSDFSIVQARGQYYIQPFMVGLTMEGLIAYYEATPDPRVLPAIKVSLDWLWANAWVPADQGFWYENYVADPTTPFPPLAGAPDLNLIIAPAYEWYYKMTGNTQYRDQGDQIFAGGVQRAWLDGAKQFNQNYSYGFDYVARRSAALGKVPPSASSIPQSQPIAAAITHIQPSVPSTPEASTSALGTPRAQPSAPAIIIQGSSIKQKNNDPKSPRLPGKKRHQKFLYDQ